MRTIQSELALFEKTGNSAHARWVAVELSKIIGESGLKSADQLHDVTVGRASGGDIKSGLLWGVVEIARANKLRQVAIMKEALMEIRNRGRKWPDAGEIAKNALDKVKEQGK